MKVFPHSEPLVIFELVSMARTAASDPGYNAMLSNIFGLGRVQLATRAKITSTYLGTSQTWLYNAVKPHARNGAVQIALCAEVQVRFELFVFNPRIDNRG